MREEDEGYDGKGRNKSRDERENMISRNEREMEG